MDRLISEVQVGRRHRVDLSDIAGLGASIRELGLLHPIVIRPDGLLIAGERRLEACKSIGMAQIQVTVVDLADVVLGELAENPPAGFFALRDGGDPARGRAAHCDAAWWRADAFRPSASIGGGKQERNLRT
jgi:ParB-like nuclease domain